MNTESQRSARLNMRISPEALYDLKFAASINHQDLSSFVLGVALERAREIIAEDQIIRLTPREVMQLEKMLEQVDAPKNKLKSLFARVHDRNLANSKP
jgi:uncharacterized protein (DUF1778 family)